MANTWVCEKCNFTADTKLKYNKHRADHAMGRIEEELVSNPDGEPMPVVKKKKEADSKPLRESSRLKTPPKPPEKHKLKLKYVFEGNCECGSNVETIETDVGSDNTKKSHIVFAFCFQCKKKIRERKVVKL